jgi:hypothetical protein
MIIPSDTCTHFLNRRHDVPSGKCILSTINVQLDVLMSLVSMEHIITVPPVVAVTVPVAFGQNFVCGMSDM